MTPRSNTRHTDGRRHAIVTLSARAGGEDHVNLLKRVIRSICHSPQKMA